MIMIGIDPGKKGAVCSLLDGVRHVHREMPPSVQGFFQLMKDYKDMDNSIHVMIEKAQPFPKGGVVSTFSYGQHYGEMLGILTALDIPHTCVGPSVWTKVMHAGCSSKDDAKAKSLQAFGRLFPGLDLRLGRRIKPHDGIVDAYLIAAYGHRTIAGVSLTD